VSETGRVLTPASQVPRHPEEDTCADCLDCPSCGGGNNPGVGCPTCGGDGYVHEPGRVVPTRCKGFFVMDGQPRQCGSETKHESGLCYAHRQDAGGPKCRHCVMGRHEQCSGLTCACDHDAGVSAPARVQP
jgi:hypothetical protein